MSLFLTSQAVDNKMFCFDESKTLQQLVQDDIPFNNGEGKWWPQNGQNIIITFMYAQEQKKRPRQNCRGLIVLT